MTVIARPPRRVTPAPTPRLRTLDRPPTPPDPSAAGSLVQVILPALGGLGMVLFMIAGGNPLLLVAGVVMLVVTLGGAIGMVVSTRFGGRRRFAVARERYLAGLDEVRAEMREEAMRQRRHDDDLHPDPVALLARVPAGRIARRSRRDPDAVMVRIGTGAAAHPVRIVLPDGEADPVTSRAMAALARSGRVLAAAPLVLDLAGGPYVLRGRLDDARLVARAILVQSAAALGSERLAISIVTAEVGAYAWARWLPHLATADGRVRIGPGTPPPTRIPPEKVDGRPLLRKLVVIEHDDTGDPARAPGPGHAHVSTADTGTCVLHLVTRDDQECSRPSSDPLDPREQATEVVVEPGARRVHVMAGDSPARTGTPDRISARFAETLARAVAGAASTRPPLDDTPSGPLPPARVLGVDRMDEFDPVGAWGSRGSDDDLLRVCIGRDEAGHEVRLDLKESARGGSGPHGVLVGATGSGKSELLRSLVLGLAAAHHPDDLAFVLVDYKGGATFSGLERLPHVAGVVTNLGEDLGLVDRMHAALLGEIRRRQQVLHDAGRLTDVYAYRQVRRRSSGEGRLAPLPHLLVVIDEFAELLTAMPEVIDLFTTIGRIGRSIGVQQLLASQRLDDGRLRGLEAFLSYRIALRTFTPEESRAVIGSSLAAELPSTPGTGYLRTERSVRFRAAHVAAPEAGARHDPPAVEVIRWFDTPPGAEPPAHEDAIQAGPTSAPPSVLDIAVARMEHAASPTRRVWSDPLPDRLGVDDLWARFGEPEPYVARLGLVDLPSEQATAPFDLDLRRGGCHVVVLGGPDTGRSATLRTLAYVLARRHDPTEVVVHGIDLDGDSLRPLDTLPHVGSIAGRRDDELARRMLRELVREVDRRSGGRAPGSPELVLLLDGYATLKADETLHGQVVALATRGADVGVHLVLTASRWHDLRPALQTALHARLELRLTDPIDSVVDRRLSAHLPVGTPGRAVVAAGRVAQLALPGDGLDEIGAYRLVAARHDYGAAPIPLLPRDLRLDTLSRAVETAKAATPGADGDVRWWLGLDEDLVPVGLGVDEPHLLVIGDRRSGRTSLLRSLLRQSLSRPDVVIALIDPRRRLIDEVPADRLAAYATNSTDAHELVLSLAGELEARAPSAQRPPRSGRPSAAAVALPGPYDTTRPVGTASRARPESRIVLVVDDAELVTGMSSPFAPLEPHLPRADELGFSLVLARHSGGAGRALYDPVLGRIKELGCPGLLLSGDPEEGPLWPSAPLRPLPAGRAVLARRGRTPLLVQLARP